MTIRYLIAGGTGFIGRHLSIKILQAGGEVSVLTRNRNSSLPYKQILWNPGEGQLSPADIEGYDVIVNLVGAGIDKRWTSSYKREIEDSRIGATSLLVDKINEVSTKPSFFVSASAIGYYGNVEDEIVDESSKNGTDFLSDLTVKWEEAAMRASGEVQVIIPRFGVILGNDGGALPQLMRGAKSGVAFNLNGRPGWKSWIHIEDTVASIVYMVEKHFEGIYNAVSPHPIKLDELMELITGLIGKKSRIRLGQSVSRIFLGEGSQHSIFEGQRVSPSKLVESGFNFKFPNIQEALRDLIQSQN